MRQTSFLSRMRQEGESGKASEAKVLHCSQNYPHIIAWCQEVASTIMAQHRIANLASVRCIGLCTVCTSCSVISRPMTVTSEKPVHTKS